MEADEEMEKIRCLVQRVRETKTPGRHGATYCYSRLVYVAFREIAALREERFSMAAICKVMESDGLLPERASLNSFRRAFRREVARRNKAANRVNAPVDKANPAAVSPNKAAQNKMGETEKELNRKMSGRVVNTGLGKIIKNSDGSFDIL